MIRNLIKFSQLGNIKGFGRNFGWVKNLILADDQFCNTKKQHARVSVKVLDFLTYKLAFFQLVSICFFQT